MGCNIIINSYVRGTEWEWCVKGLFSQGTSVLQNNKQLASAMSFLARVNCWNGCRIWSQVVYL